MWLRHLDISTILDLMFSSQEVTSYVLIAEGYSRVAPELPPSGAMQAQAMEALHVMGEVLVQTILYEIPPNITGMQRYIRQGPDAGLCANIYQSTMLLSNVSQSPIQKRSSCLRNNHPMPHPNERGR